MLFYFSILLLKNFRFFAFFHGSRMTSYIFFQFFFTLRLMSNLQRVFSPKMSPVRCLYQKLIFCKFTLIINRSHVNTTHQMNSPLSCNLLLLKSLFLFFLFLLRVAERALHREGSCQKNAFMFFSGNRSEI